MSGRRRAGALLGVRYARRGLHLAWRSERNLRIHLAVALVAFAATVWLRADPVPILLAVGLVLVAELANTAVERAVDLQQPNSDPNAAAAKDVAAGAVLVAATIAVLVGIMHLGPLLLARLMGGP